MNKLQKFLDGWTVEELLESYKDFCEKVNAEYGDIPEDGNCHECPHSNAGSCRGMVTPCFDICAGNMPLFGDDSTLSSKKEK